MSFVGHKADKLDLGEEDKNILLGIHMKTKDTKKNWVSELLKWPWELRLLEWYQTP